MMDHVFTTWQPCDIVQWSETFENYNDSNIDSQSTIGLDGKTNSGVDVTDDFAFSSDQSILLNKMMT